MSCPLCGGLTFIFEDVDGERIAKPCSCRRKREDEITLKNKLIDARIPPIFWDFDMEHYMKLPFKPEIRSFNEKNVLMLQSFIKDPKLLLESKKQVLWIWGTQDNACHTTLATILGTALIKNDIKVRFIKMNKLIESCMDFDDKKGFFENLDTYKVFIIDDAFDTTRSSAKEYAIINIYNWIDSQISQGKLFICTSNVPLKEIPKQYMQSAIVMSRNSIEMELRGSITSTLQK
jgi:hypothetical protein